jgi:hypothetical protein
LALSMSFPRDRLANVPVDRIVALIDQFSEEKDISKQTAILKEIQALLAQLRVRLKAEKAAASD